MWAAVTESDRLGRWVGTWTGDPTTGSVLFRMNAEGDDIEPETFTIHECVPPRRIAADLAGRGRAERLPLPPRADRGRRHHDAHVQPVRAGPGHGDGVGPGWEYYLDRLVAAETGADVAGVDFGDYYPAQSEYYRALFA